MTDRDQARTSADGTKSPERDLFRGTGEMPGRMRAHDWSPTPLGPPALWPESLRSSLSICVGSRFPIAIYWGPELALLYNDAWSPILGTKHPAALGRPALEVWPEIWDTIGPLFAQVMTSGEATYAEDSLLAMHRHGYTEECYFNYSFTPIRGQAGATEGVFNAVIETTYRVIADRRTQLLGALAEKLGAARSVDGVCAEAAAVLAHGALDAPFAAIYLLDASTAKLMSAAHAPAEVPAGQLELIVGSADDESLWQLERAGARRGATVVPLSTFHFRGPAPGGPWAEAATSAMVTPLWNATGHVIGFTVLGASPRRGVDDAYRRFAEQVAELSEKAITAARAFEEERTRAAKLAELDRAKTTFFSNVSHELRTPLTLILGPLEDAARSSSRSLEGPALEAAQRNGMRLLKLVNTLLDFSRIEAGRADASYVETDIAALTRELASAFESAVHAAKLRFVVDCPPQNGPIYVDRDMWEKIVLNLLSNAVKFTFEGQIAIRLRQAGNAIELEVADTGGGIPEADLPHVFERFRRVSGARSRTHEGSGIGLALVSDLAKLHGGSVAATSRLGVGSTFVVRIPTGHAHLPAERVGAASALASTALGVAPYVQEALRWLPGDDAPEADEAASPRELANAVDDVTAGAHILLADDNLDMREYLGRLLSRRWKVTAVSDGEEALAAVRRETPDLVLTDVMMPNLDGFGLLGRLRADPSLRRIPVIMLSARAGEESRADGIEAGADDYLVKPFAARELMARVSTHIQLGRLRRVAEAAHQNLVALLDQAPAAISVREGPEHRLTLANARYCEIGRKTVAEIVGKTLVEAFPQLIGTELLAAADAAYNEGRTISREELPGMTVGADGAIEAGFYNLTVAPLRAADGTITGSMSVSFDVSEQVLGRQRLEAARAEAEQANRAKDDFLAMLGHELRNPLAPILTALQLVRLRGNDNIGREVEVIERQAQHLVRLVDDLLDVSRIARGKVTLSKESVEIADVIAAAIETASPIIESGRHRLITDVPKHGLVVDVDRVRMAQVIANLLTNAAKYTPTGGRIIVSATREDTDVVIRVEDSGTGIAQELLPNVFDLFVQARQTLARSQGGLGLGLTIVKSLVAVHGGTVLAESEGLGRGSSFTVRLPALGSRADSPKRAEAATPVKPRHQRILVVDDNEDAAEMLSEALQMLGYRTAIANDGPAALLLAVQFDPHTALLDIGLPAMDGYELARRLRAQAGSRLRLVAVTGYGQASDRQRSSEAGFDEHLTKPVDFGALAKLLERSVALQEE
jgi:signal transduction histidine kinase/FixJ family two-component response regulator